MHLADVLVKRPQAAVVVIFARTFASRRRQVLFCVLADRVTSPTLCRLSALPLQHGSASDSWLSQSPNLFGQVCFRFR